jgi:hypothetical protein
MDGNDNYNFQKLTPKVIPDFPVCVWSGSRRTGKTTHLRYLMYLMQHSRHKFDAVYVMCGSAATRKILAKNCVPFMMTDHFAASTIMALITSQEEIVDSGGHPQHILIILDDLGFDKKKLNASTALAKLLKNGRHAHVTVFMTTHSALDMNCDLRENVDLTFFPGTYANKRNVLDKIYKNYASSFPTFRAFANGYRETTMQRSWMAIMTDPMRTKVSECIFWLRAHIPEMEKIVDEKHQEQYHIGRKSYWDAWRRYRRRATDPKQPNGGGAPAHVPKRQAVRAYPGGPEIRCVGNEEDLHRIEEEKNKQRRPHPQPQPQQQSASRHPPVKRDAPSMMDGDRWSKSKPAAAASPRQSTIVRKDCAPLVV